MGKLRDSKGRFKPGHAKVRKSKKRAKKRRR
jgi:hypothetical protein